MKQSIYLDQYCLMELLLKVTNKDLLDQNVFIRMILSGDFSIRISNSSAQIVQCCVWSLMLPNCVPYVH